MPKYESEDSPQLRRTLVSLYTGDYPGAYGSAKNLYKEAQSRGFGITLKQVKKFLARTPAYALHRYARTNIPRNPLVANYVGELVQIDIMDMGKYLAWNDDYRYAVVAYDTYSKFMAITPIKRKNKTDVKAGLSILLQKKLPFTVTTIYWDKVSPSL